MPKAKVGGINVYYEVHGEGDPVLMIMGGGWHCGLWGPLQSNLAREYKTIIFDNRGAGWTDAPDYPYAFNMMADDAADLLDTLGVESAHVMGCSMGGHTAQHFALDHPEKVISLVLMCTEATPVKADANEVGETIIAGWPQSFVDVARFAFFTPEFLEKNPKIFDDIQAKFLEKPGPPHGFRHQLEATRIHNTLERLPQIKAPTLVVGGEHDYVIPVAGMRELAKGIPNAELVIWDDVGHVFFHQEPERTSKTILDFLRRHPKK